MSQWERSRDRYAGTGRGMFYILADFGVTVAPWPKLFGIDKETAKAKTNPDWNYLLGKRISEGKKQKFCCGKIAEGVCCCGGWTHTDMQVSAVHNMTNCIDWLMISRKVLTAPNLEAVQIISRIVDQRRAPNGFIVKTYMVWSTCPLYPRSM